MVLISFLFFFPEEKTSLIIINVCCVVFFSLAPKRRIHPRERNVRDQRHFVAETYLRDGHRGWRRVWGEHSHFCGELSTSKRRMMFSRNFCTNDTREREREREGIRRRVTAPPAKDLKLLLLLLLVRVVMYTVTVVTFSFFKKRDSNVTTARGNLFLSSRVSFFYMYSAKFYRVLVTRSLSISRVVIFLCMLSFVSIFSTSVTFLYLNLLGFHLLVFSASDEQAWFLYAHAVFAQHLSQCFRRQHDALVNLP